MGQPLSNPTHERNIEVGLTLLGQTRQEAQETIEAAFEDLGGLVNHIAVIDMAGALERYVRSVLPTAIGEARKVVRERYRTNVPLYRQREHLIHEAEEFEGLANLDKLIGSRSSGATQQWEARRNRNSFAHGTDVRSPPTITSLETRAALKEIISIL